jgi:RsiW-degrading membrane proteinase PrsW (M82 family)
MIVIELLVLVLALVGVGVFLSFQPEKLQEAQSFLQLLNNQTDQEVALRMVAPYLSDPRVIAGLLGYIALIVPLIEEMLKPLAVWLFAKSIAKPSQGFVLGMLSGAAFAMVESLNASAESSEAWPFAVGVRAGTSLLHIMLSGLMGYAIVGAFQEKRFGRLVGTYFTAVSIHGIWNACAIGAGLSANGDALGKAEWLTKFLPASIGGILVLGVGMFFVLLASNRKLRSEVNPAPVLAPVEDKE